MNATQRLWQKLKVLLPPEQITELQTQYAEDAQRDRHNSAYRTYQRRYRAALQSGDSERITKLAHWLIQHETWKK